MRWLILALFLIFVLVGCSEDKVILPGEKTKATIGTPTPQVEKIGEPEADTVTDGISDVVKLDDELSLDDFSGFESDLNSLSW